MKNKLSAVLLFLLAGNIAIAAPPEEGKAIFLSRCAACHQVNKAMTGPALAGVADRRTEDWIIKFVRSSQSVIKSGDPAAVSLFSQFNGTMMPDHADLSDDNIRSVIDFIKSEGSKVVNAAPFATPTKLMPAYRPLSIQQDPLFFIGYLAAVGLLVLSLLFALRAQNYRRQKRREEGPA